MKLRIFNQHNVFFLYDERIVKKIKYDPSTFNDGINFIENEHFSIKFHYEQSSKRCPFSDFEIPSKDDYMSLQNLEFEYNDEPHHFLYDGTRIYNENNIYYSYITGKPIVLLVDNNIDTFSTHQNTTKEETNFDFEDIFNRYKEDIKKEMNDFMNENNIISDIKDTLFKHIIKSKEDIFKDIFKSKK